MTADDIGRVQIKARESGVMRRADGHIKRREGGGGGRQRSDVSHPVRLDGAATFGVRTVKLPPGTLEEEEEVVVVVVVGVVVVQGGGGR